MDIGLAYFPTHDALGPGEVARLAEERGFESLFFAEHTHIPARTVSPWPGGDHLPRRYYHTYDLFVAMTAAALATRRLRIGSGICLIIERDPIITAKEVASIDALSGGRVELGVGAGWNREEMSHHGTDPRVRMAVMAERVGAMKAIWTEDEATYQGGLRVVRADLVVHQALAETSPADIGGRVRADSSRPCARFWGRVVPQLWASRPAGQGRPAQSPG